MICFVDDCLDFHAYITGYLIWKKLFGKGQDHGFGVLTWDKDKLNLGGMKDTEKLYIIAHLDEFSKTLANGGEGGLSANDLGGLLVNGLGLPSIAGIVLIACEGGLEDEGHFKRYPFGRVLSDKILLDKSAKIPVTGYKGDVNVDSTGKVIAYHSLPKTGAADDDPGEAEREAWAGPQAPSSPEELKAKVLSLGEKKTWLAAYEAGMVDVRPRALSGENRKAKF
jgi:hypothetical protein